MSSPGPSNMVNMAAKTMRNQQAPAQPQRSAQNEPDNRSSSSGSGSETLFRGVRVSFDGAQKAGLWSA
eukprot:CAMPEP_0202864866 /NCGR_PEP_ID=MMETSP1391-20130828/4929_1 /ASSEMBLY_ACC=CAM_ASM_000867 /TAXON_ID=1034604 /ORGANISM="Chlamydomonas leiostraca, Strain SAG 11-49" /LENGTH=67 /DNA_ID=CAMNT_0049544639 /DNA_START=138 /DNA_END=341 /DNA_ORIENTATION=-